MDEPREAWVEPGRVLVEEGRPSPFVYVVLEGRATVSYGGRELATLGPGATIGAAGARSGAPRLATVTAASRMHLHVWSLDFVWPVPPAVGVRHDTGGPLAGGVQGGDIGRSGDYGSDIDSEH